MKYGVIVFQGTRNIGDDIQSYAAAQLLPQVDYYIEREQLDVFRPNENAPVNVILNGWLMYNKLAWPVSPCINPLYISMHFYHHDALGIEDSFLDEFGKEDLLSHEPIGCRDVETQRMLEKNGIQTWFSGCMTLTLKPKYPETEKKDIYLVDVPEEIEQFVRKKYPLESIHILSQEADGIVDRYADWQTRFGNVEKLLTRYQNAKAVITTRLHCAMPCLALGTPVLLLIDSDIVELGRFDGLSQFVRNASKKDFLQGNIDFDLRDPAPNSDKYLAVRSRLETQVKRFIEDNQTCSLELLERFSRYDKEWEQRAIWKNKQIEKLQCLANLKWKQDHEWLEELTEANEWHKNRSIIFEQLLAEKVKQFEEIEQKNDELELLLLEKDILINQYQNRVIIRIMDNINQGSFGEALSIIYRVLKKRLRTVAQNMIGMKGKK